MAPRNECPSTPSSRAIRPSLFRCIPDTWPVLALCSAASALIGLVFFIVGIIGVIRPGGATKARDWIFLCMGILMLAIGLSLLVLCRIRSSRSRSAPTPSRRRRRTRPSSRREPLPVWSIDAIDPSFRPPPSYSEAIHCPPSSPTAPVPPNVSVVSRPPPYSPSPGQPKITDV